MKSQHVIQALGVIGISFMLSCSGNSSENQNTEAPADVSVSSTNGSTAGQAGVSDDVSNPNVVKVAVNSKDHSTLVTAVQTADLVNALSNNGPFTVFAPTNAAFDALPAGTVEGLLKPEKKDALTDILQYHVYVGVLNTENLQDGQVIGMVNGGNATIHVTDGKYMINDANIVTSVPASNGIVHVIDKVILPPSK
ncbi:MAG TPA: fasciclin domain-containing protein [Bacteroidia bacterium]|nr:fasciclin domain-containing protein [Bacteroidia bacterium]